jgi:myo-inositol-1-phosphate synthase
MQKKIKVAIAGVGNCASALVQGVEYYRSRRNAALDGVMHQTIGGYRASDVEFVSAFDVDKRKVGRPLEEAIFAKRTTATMSPFAQPIWSRPISLRLCAGLAQKCCCATCPWAPKRP